MFTRSPQRRSRRRLSTADLLLFFRTFIAAFLLILAGRPRLSYAFPEMVRHGYGNCISCHYSPTGGGVLTDYGRQLSREVLSTWGNPGEENFAFGTTPKWMALGGDLRTLNLRSESPAGFQDSLILMQADLEAALTYRKFSFVGTIGRLDTAIYPQSSGWISRRHYLLYRPTDELSVRAGRFNRAYGINMCDHFTTVKQGLNWDIGTETYAIEGAWITDQYNVYGTIDFGRPDDPSLQREHGLSASGSVFLADRYKVGASYFYGTNDIATRNVFGPWGLLGFTEHFFALSEFDFQRNFAFNFIEPQWGFANYNRLDYELVQGLHFFGTAEFEKVNFLDSNTLTLRYGLGVQFFPRPHFELEASWESQQVAAISPNFLEVAWFMIHYYL